MSYLPKVGVLGLSLKLHDIMSPGLKQDREQFLKKVLDSIKGAANFSFHGPCNTKQEVDDVVRIYEAEKMDALLVIFLTYAPSLICLQALKRIQLPIIIWNTQEAVGVPYDAPPRILLENHGVHGVQDLCCALNRSEIGFHLLTGHWKDEGTLEELIRILKAANTITTLCNAKIGLVGYSMQDMGDFNVDETAFLSQVGASVVHIPVDELGDLVLAVPEDRVKEVMLKDKERFHMDEGITIEEHFAAARMELAIRHLIEIYSLNAWCQHFAVLNSSDKIPCQPYLAASKLMGEGIFYAAEGDATVAAASIIMNCITGNATFTEMFTMDFYDNALFMRHIGELNISMARKDRPVRIIKKSPNDLRKSSPLTPVFSLEPGETTLISLTTGPKGKMRIVAAEGEILDLPEAINMDSPTYKWRPYCRLKEFLNNYSAAGGSHHQAIGYGKVIKYIEFLADCMKIDFIRV